MASTPCFQQSLPLQFLRDVGPEVPPEPPPPSTRVAKQLAKTRFCKHFLRGFCRYMERCAYAHCSEELQARPNLANTKICIGFLTGTCWNGANCTYAHGLEQLRRADPSQSTPPLEDHRKPVPLQQWSQGNGQLPPSVLQAAQEAAQQAAEEAAKRVIHQEASRWLGQQPGQQPLQQHASALLQPLLQQPPMHPWQQEQQEQQEQQRQRELQQQQQQQQHQQQEQYQRQQQQQQQQEQYQRQQEQYQRQRRHQLPLQQLVQPGVTQPLDGMAQTMESDQELIHEVLEEIMQLLIEEDQLERHDAQPTSAAQSIVETRWEGLTKQLRRKRRKGVLQEGMCLISNERKKDLSFSEEQIVLYIFLREPEWVKLFPGLVSRCSKMMASRMVTKLPMEGSGMPSGPIPVPPPELQHSFTGPAAGQETPCSRAWSTSPQAPQEPQVPHAPAKFPAAHGRPRGRRRKVPEREEVPVHSLFTRSMDILPETALLRQAPDDAEAGARPPGGRLRRTLRARSVDSPPLPRGVGPQDHMLCMLQDRQALRQLSKHIKSSRCRV